MRGLVLLAALLVSAGAVWGAAQVEPRVDFVDTVPDDPDLALYRDLLARLDGVRFVAVHMPFDAESGLGDLRTDEGFDAVVWEQKRLQERLDASFPEGTFSHHLGVYEAMRGAHHMLLKQATAGSPPDGSYALPADPVTWSAARDEVRGGSGGEVLAGDGQSALLLAFLATRDDAEARDTAGAVQDVLAAWSADPAQHPATRDHAATGLLVAQHETDARNRADLLIWGAAAAAGVAVALLWAVRRPGNVLIAVACVAAATLWTFGLMGVLGIRISFLTVFLAPLVIGVGVDYAVHLLHRYEEERDHGARHREALSVAVRRVGPAVALAAATTAVGLAVLGLVPAPLFAEIGLVAALGIALAFVAALTLAPALRAAAPGARRPRRDRVGPWLGRTAVALHRRPRTVAAVLVMLLAAAAVAATGTRLGVGEADNEFPADDPQLLLRQRIEAEYGAFERAYLVVEGELEEPAALRALDEATREAAAIPGARAATSVTDLLRADAATDEGAADIAASVLFGSAGAEAPGRGLPDSRDEARAALDRLAADPLWGRILPFTLSEDRRLAVVALSLDPWEDQDALLALRDALEDQEEALQARLGPDYRVAAAGSPVNRAAVVEQSPWNVLLATAGAAGAVGAVLAVAWRRRPGGLRTAAGGAGLVLGAALLLVATVPVLDAAYGVWHAWTGAPANHALLSDMFLLAFAVTVAVGIDDLVHVAHRFWEARDAGRGREAALEHAFRHAGRAVTATSLTTFVAFALLSGVYFLQSKNLAILAACGVLYAYLLTLLAAPALLAGRPDPVPAGPRPAATDG